MSSEAEKRQGLSASTRDKVVTIEIGPERTKYYIHRALLEEHSEYFKKALNGPWKEAEEGVIPLEDVECATFDVFVNWLYTGKLPTKSNDWVARSESESEHQWIIQHELLRIKVCVFGDRFLAPGFQRAVQNGLVDRVITREDQIFYPAISYAFDNLPSENPILRLLVDAQCHHWKHDLDTEENGELRRRDQLPNSFLVRVMVRYSKIVEGADHDLVRCDYHEHASKAERKKCKE